MKIFLSLLLIGIMVLPMLSFAQGQGLGDPAPIENLGDVGGLVSTIVNWMIGIFWIITVAFLIWAAFLYLTAGGEEEKLNEAKSRVIYALIAAAIALLSTGIQAIVRNLLTNPVGN